MSRLHTERLRLHLIEPAADAPEGPGLIGADGRVRALVLGLGRPADWALLGAVWRGVQTDLGLPAPAIAVSGTDSHQLWFSLSQAVPPAQALGFLQAVCERYLPETPAARIDLWPRADAQAPGGWLPAPLVPAQQAATGDWSAFLSPDLPAVFGDTPWLDMPPGLDAQAELLSRLASATPAEWSLALQRLGVGTGEDRVKAVAPSAPVAARAAAPASEALSPRAFLLGVMNDPTAPLALRIEAAKALLPGSGG